MTGNEYAQKIAGLQKISRIKNNNITCKQSPGLSTTSIHTFELLLIEQEQGRKIKKEKERRKGKSNDTYDPILYERKVDLRNIKICFTKKEGDGSVLSFIKGRYRYKRDRSSKGGRWYGEMKNIILELNVQFSGKLQFLKLCYLVILGKTKEKELFGNGLP